eukprot:scaffold1506_cov118-Isochrysis_galbana.AAC.4
MDRALRRRGTTCKESHLPGGVIGQEDYSCTHEAWAEQPAGFRPGLLRPTLCHRNGAGNGAGTCGHLDRSAQDRNAGERASQTPWSLYWRRSALRPAWLTLSGAKPDPAPPPLRPTLGGPK